LIGGSESLGGAIVTPEATPPLAPLEGRVDLPTFPTDLPEADGEPLESDWHRAAISLLIEVVRYFFRARRDFFAGGNMFLYFSEEQIRNKDYRGPDFFFTWGVQRDKPRRYYAVWQEGGKYPDVIIELLSPTTANEDRTTKKTLYEKVFSTREYFLYDPDTRQLEGYRLHGTNGYESIEREQDGRMWSRTLELYLGTWDGQYLETSATWLRFFDVHGNLILTGREDVSRLIEVERRRADNAEAELERLRARVAELEGRS
jgi:Uma2 family endonuclease